MDTLREFGRFSLLLFWDLFLYLFKSVAPALLVLAFVAISDGSIDGDPRIFVWIVFLFNLLVFRKSFRTKRMRRQLEDINRELDNIRSEIDHLDFETSEFVSAQHQFDSVSRIDCMSGHEFEKWCAALLLKIGFETADVTQASGDDGVDIIAVKDGVRYAIQCKRYNTNLGNAPIQEVYAGKAVYHCDIAVVMTNSYFTPSGKRSAAATGTRLWDRDWISEKLASIDRANQKSLNISNSLVSSSSPLSSDSQSLEPPLVKSASSSGRPVISDELSQFIHLAQWQAATEDDEWQ